MKCLDGVLAANRVLIQDSLTEVGWKNIEERISPHQKQVCNAMMSLGSDCKIEQSPNKFITFGDDYQEFARRYMFETKIRPKRNNPKEEKKTKKGKYYISRLTDIPDYIWDKGIEDAKKWIRQENKGRIHGDDIIRLNTISKVTEKTKLIVEDSKDIRKLKTAFGDPCFDVRAIALILGIKHSLHHNVGKSTKFGLITTAKEVLAKSSYLKENGVSSVLLEDIQSVTSELCNESGFSHREVCFRYPSLLLGREYKVLPDQDIRPYPSQIEFMETVRMNKQFLIQLVSAVGSGKTMLSIALASYVKGLRSHERVNKSKTRTSLLYICTIGVVREDVCRALWNEDIGLAVGTIDKSQSMPKITKNYNCQGDDDNIIAIVADIPTAICLLEKKNNKKYIVFFDEPTFGADQSGHPVTSLVPMVIRLSERLVLCSATLAPEEKIPKTIGVYREKYPDGKVSRVGSSVSYIGTDLVSSETGNTFLPHRTCETIKELRTFYDLLISCPLIRKLYTPVAVYRLYDTVRDNISISSIDKYFSNPEMCTQYYTEEFALQIISKVIETEDDRIVALLSDCSEWKDSQNHTDDINYKFSLKSFLTKSAHLYLGGALIACAKPLAMAREAYRLCLSDMTYSSIIKKYNAQNTAIKRQAERREKHADKEFEIIKTEPTLKFPSERRVNTLEHLKKWTKRKVDQRLLQEEQSIGSLDISGMADTPEWMTLLLMSGVGVYTEKENLSRGYTTEVLRLAKQEKLMCLISDETFSLGVNYPIVHAIIDDSLVEDHSMNTLFQLAFRGGRVGVRDVGIAHVGKEFEKKLAGFVKDPGKPSVEVTNMEAVASRPIRVTSYCKKSEDVVSIGELASRMA